MRGPVCAGWIPWHCWSAASDYIVSAAIVHYEPGARTVGDCRCGGALRLVEDLGEPRPLEAQCEACGVLTGVARNWSPQTSFAAPAPGSPEDLGF